MKLTFSVFRTMMLSALLLVGSAVQARVITGVVKDATGETIISASVVVKGTSIGTVTDFDGNYTIDVPDDAKELVFSYIGMTTQELPITGDVINVVLSENSEVLEEVVVTGYGTTKKRDVVTSVASVSAEQLKDIPVASASEALQGKLAGVTVTTTEGAAGADEEGYIWKVLEFQAIGGDVEIKEFDGGYRITKIEIGNSQAVDNIFDGAKAEKIMENGQLVIIKNGVKFNALGAQL